MDYTTPTTQALNYLICPPRQDLIRSLLNIIDLVALVAEALHPHAASEMYQDIPCLNESLRQPLARTLLLVKALLYELNELLPHEDLLKGLHQATPAQRKAVYKLLGIEE